jgi:hypothetical protein
MSEALAPFFSPADYQRLVVKLLAMLATSSAIDPATVTPQTLGLPVIPVDSRVSSVDAGINYNSSGNVGTIPATKRYMSITNLNPDPTALIYVRKGTGATAANSNFAIPGGGRDIIDNYVGIVSVFGSSVDVQVSIE